MGLTSSFWLILLSFSSRIKAAGSTVRIRLALWANIAHEKEGSGNEALATAVNGHKSFSFPSLLVYHKVKLRLIRDQLDCFPRLRWVQTRKDSFQRLQGFETIDLVTLAADDSIDEVINDTRMGLPTFAVRLDLTSFIEIPRTVHVFYNHLISGVRTDQYPPILTLNNRTNSFSKMTLFLQFIANKRDLFAVRRPGIDIDRALTAKQLCKQAGCATGTWH